MHETNPTAPLDRHQVKKLLAPLLLPHRWTGLVILLCSISSAGLAVVAPWLLGQATNVVVDGVIGRTLPPGVTKAAAEQLLISQGHPQVANLIHTSNAIPGQGVQMDRLAQALLIAFGAFACQALLYWMAGFLTRRIVMGIGWELRQAVHLKVRSLPLSFLDRNSRGDVLSRLTNDVANTTQTLTQTVTELLASIIAVVGMAAMMFSISWRLTLLAFIVLPLGGIGASWLMRAAKPHFKQKWHYTGEVSAVVEDAFTGHTEMVAYGLKPELEREFKTANTGLFNASYKSLALSGMIYPLMGIVGNISYVVVAVAGGLQVAAGNLSIGGVQAFIQYARQFNQPIGQIASMVTMLQSGMASASRIAEFLQEEEMAPEAGEHLPASAVAGRITFTDVNFGYEEGKPVITNFNLAVEPGQTVAIVGRTGAGKTTLVNLLMRFYELNSGTIALDGHDIATIPKAELRARLGMVLQDTWLFEGTIAENIAYGKLGSVDREAIEAAARATAIDHMIRALPDGYDTVIDSEGEGISAGQKQLITIARAFLADPEVLILDEATSSVDTSTEAAVQLAMSHLRQGRTSFVIAHRLSTIRDADKIIVMEHGDVVESGTHAELLARGGAYAKLYNSQFELVDQEG